MVETKFKESDTNALAKMNNAQNNVVEAREDRDRDLTATWLIQSCIEDSIFPWISGDTSAHQAWNLLASSYKGIEC